uniref:Translational initiation factor 1 n=1 Tax=Gonocaryum lobbianum TaxID=2545981 RepID=A0A481X5K6_9ASTE|nr:translational initiation factor 1 [Gonocaryum lobbianum]QBK32700.1 translational initiation factor 1 [Gonocaryum lobbianum]
MKKKKWIHEGLITESLPNDMFRVRLDNEDLILGYVLGKIRRSFIRILPGDRVKIEVSHSTKGHIISRLRNKASKDWVIFQLQHSFRGNTIRDEKCKKFIFFQEVNSELK